MSSRTFVAAAAVLALAASCGRQRNSEPIVGPIVLNEQQSKGQLVFFRNCNECHPNGQAGLAPALNNTLFTEAMIKHQVRQPIASMPNFSEDIIPAADLDALVAYLFALKQADDRDLVPSPEVVPRPEGHADHGG
jgi:mono/diheme cytochrome c family protein